jgi:hypothetical protein
MLTLAMLPRLPTLTLVGSLVQTELAGHAHWWLEVPAARKQQRSQSTKCRDDCRSATRCLERP